MRLDAGLRRGGMLRYKGTGRLEPHAPPTRHTSMTISPVATRRSHSTVLLVILTLLWVAARPAVAQSLPSGVHRAGDDGVTAPRVVRQVAPAYPVEAKRAGVHGVVQLEAIVAPTAASRTFASSTRSIASMDSTPKRSERPRNGASRQGSRTARPFRSR